MFGGDEKEQYMTALVVVVLLVILGLVSLQLFLFAKVGGSSVASFGAGAGATILPGYGSGSRTSGTERFRR